MKNLIHIFSVIFLISGFNPIIYSQSKKTIQYVHQSKNMHGTSFERCVQHSISIIPEYNFSTSLNSSLIQVIPSFKTSGLKTFEGMEVENVGKGSINFRITNEITGSDTIIRFQYQVKSSTEYLAVEKAILEKFEKDPSAQIELQKVFSKNFMEIQQCKTNAIDQLLAEEKMKEALSLALKYKRHTPECTEKLKPLISVLTKKMDSIACQKTLFEAEILINSGIEHKINKAVDMMLQISPSADCVKEVLALSEKISTQRNLSAKSKNKMERYKVIIAEKKSNDWYELIEY